MEKIIVPLIIAVLSFSMLYPVLESVFLALSLSAVVAGAIYSEISKKQGTTRF